MEICTTSWQCGFYICLHSPLLSDFMHVVLTEHISWEETVKSENLGFTFKVLSGKMSSHAKNKNGAMMFN